LIFVAKKSGEIKVIVGEWVIVCNDHERGVRKEIFGRERNLG
jgi:hypothetical protein